MIRCAALLIVLCLPTSGVAQNSIDQAATDAALQLEVASESLRAAQTSRDRVAALTTTVRAYEDGLVAMRTGLRNAAVRRQAVENRLNAKRDDIAKLLGVLQALGQSASPTLLLHPSGPTGLARSGMIATEIAPALQQEVDTLRDELEELKLLQDLQNSAADTLDQGLRGAQTARSELSAAIANRTDLPRRFEDDPVQTALLLASAETLSAFASGLTDAFSVENNTAYSTDVKGALTMPLQGPIVRGFNAPDADGDARPGLTIAGRAKALVNTPTPATVLFVGPLLDYGNVAILEPAPNVLFVMAGLNEIFVDVGQVIPKGFPIGLLGGETPSVDGILTQSEGGNSGRSTQTLYLEVREGQSPVDPATWFALQ